MQQLTVWFVRFAFVATSIACAGWKWDSSAF